MQSSRLETQVSYDGLHPNFRTQSEIPSKENRSCCPVAHFVANLSRDVTNRVKTLVYGNGSNQIQAKYSDGTILSLVYDPINRVTTMSDWTGVTTYSFDARSLLTGKTDPGSLVQAYSYDSNSNRTLLVDPDQGLWTSVYDSLDRVLAAYKPSNHIYSFAYDADSRRTTLQMGLETVRVYAYDSANRLTTQIEYSGATPIFTFIDSYDPVDNRIGRNQNGSIFTWTYDADYRLLGQQNAGGYATFSYDSRFNTLVKWNQGSAPVTMSYDAASRIATSISGSTVTTYTFDNAGNTWLENANGQVTTNRKRTVIPTQSGQ